MQYPIQQLMNQIGVNYNYRIEKRPDDYYHYAIIECLFPSETFFDTMDKLNDIAIEKGYALVFVPEISEYKMNE